MNNTLAETHVTRHWPWALGLVAGIASVYGQTSWSPGGFTTWFLPVLALTYLVFGVARGHMTKQGMWSLQFAGLLIFSLLAVVALVVNPAVGQYVVAAGWAAHAAWDAYHLRKDLVVPNWYAKACIAADLTVALAVVLA